MEASYLNNYLKIYFWQILSIVLNLVSLFIVIPKLSGSPDIYGIYSICIASLLFLTYADLGFLNAGYKYASESYAVGNKQEETEITGFVSFILLLFVALFIVIMTVLAFNPQWLIKNLTNEDDRLIARNLLLILAFFSPTIIIQRFLQITFGVRLQDFVLQKILIVTNLLKILSVLYFFRGGHYEIVQYFFFCQLVTALGLIFATILTSTRYGISIWNMLRSLRFSKKIYVKVKALAFNSLFVTISWILFYELDPYVIGKLSGAAAVGYYAIGLTCLSFFRSIFGTFFNPFVARFNHLIAQKDEVRLQQLCMEVICILLPVVVFPIVSIIILAKPFVFAWLGEKFAISIPVVQFLILSNILAFIAYPTSILLTAIHKIRKIYVISIVQLVVFWVGVFFTYKFVEFHSFAYFKAFAFIIAGGFYIHFIYQYFQLKPWDFFRKILAPAILPIGVLVLTLLAVRGYLPLEKSKLNLIVVVAAGAVASILPAILYYFQSDIFRTNVKRVLRLF